MAGAAENAKIAVSDVVQAAADGVLRVLEARQAGDRKLQVNDLVKSGFMVDIKITAGGFPGPLIDLLKGAGPASRT